MRHALLLACLLLGSACVRSSDPRLYTLVASPGRQTYPLAATIELRRPSIAGYLDRREIVRGIQSERLDVADDANWAEPLDAMFGRVLAANLAARLPKSQVFTDLNTLGVTPERVVDVSLERFEQGTDGLVLRAMVAIRVVAQVTPPTLQTVSLQASASRKTGDIVAAQNKLLGELADAVAGALARTEQTSGLP